VSVTPASFKDELPEFASVPDNTVQKWLTRCAQMLNPDRWGRSYDDGLIFRTAHQMVVMGVVAGMSATASAVKSKTVGPVSVTYDTPQDTRAEDTELERTKYGRMFKALRRTLVRSPMVL